MEAQRFPEDYQGILAGAPTNSWTRLQIAAADVDRIMTATPQSYLSPSKFPTIARAVRLACEAKPDAINGMPNDPHDCNFIPSALRCSEQVRGTA